MNKNRKKKNNVRKDVSDWTLPEDIELVKCAICGAEGFVSRSGEEFEGCTMVFTDEGQIVCDFCQPPSKATKGYWLGLS